MKHLELAKHYRKIVIILINKGYIEEAFPPKQTLQVRMRSKVSDTGLDWSLTIPGESLTLTVKEGTMFIDYVNKRIDFKWTRKLNEFIDSLDPRRYPDDYAVIIDEHRRMKAIIRTMVAEHTSGEVILERRKRKAAILKEILAKQSLVEIN